VRFDYQGDDEEATRQDAAIKQLLGLTPHQIDNYIDNNVSNLVSAKAVLKRFGKILLLLAKRTL
jgi:hypothetical protein